MIQGQNDRYSVLVKQVSYTNAATSTSDNLDSKGYRQVTFIVHGSTSNDVTNNPSVLKVQESDITDATGFADVTALVGDGVGGFTIPNSVTATTTAPFAVLGYRVKKRYQRVLISPVTTQVFSVLAIQHAERAEEAPDNITEQNIAVRAVG